MNHNRTVLVFSLALGLMTTATIPGQQKVDKSQTKAAAPIDEPLVTFVELGSVKCLPCRQMQPVMKAIQQKYGNQVRVVFHDVWTDAGREHAEAYKIRLIPTQVFLDRKGEEFFRHEGFFPEEEIHKLLQKRGLKQSKSEH